MPAKVILSLQTPKFLHSKKKFINLQIILHVVRTIIPLLTPLIAGPPTILIRIVRSGAFGSAYFYCNGVKGYTMLVIKMLAARMMMFISRPMRRKSLKR